MAYDFKVGDKVYSTGSYGYSRITVSWVDSITKAGNFKLKIGVVITSDGYERGSRDSSGFSSTHWYPVNEAVELKYRKQKTTYELKSLVDKFEFKIENATDDEMEAIDDKLHDLLSAVSKIKKAGKK